MAAGHGAQLRFWFVDRFTRTPSGSRVQVSGDSFAAVMGRLDVTATVTVPDRLGSARTRTFTLAFRRPRAFRLGDLVEADPVLSKLDALAAKLERERTALPDAAAAQVEAIAGPGPLSRSLRGEPEPDASSVPTPIARDRTAPLPHTAAQANEPDAPVRTPHDPTAPLPQGDLFGATILPSSTPSSPVTTARSSLDAFVGAILGRRSTPRVAPTSERLGAAGQIRHAVAQTALDVFAHPDVASLEASWRGLKFVVGEAPGHDHLSIVLVDADPADPTSALTMPAAHAERPDAIFVGPQLGDIALVRRLATIAAEARVPVVIAIDEGLPFEDLSDIVVSEPSDAWRSLTADPASTWLCAAMNPIALVHETTPVGPRLLGGSPAFAIAALLAAAFDRNAGLQPIAGPARAIVAPAAHDADLGAGQARTIPTAYFAPIDLQQAGAKQGVAILGSPAGSDRILVVETPTVSGGGTADGLVARIRQAHASRVATL